MWVSSFTHIRALHTLEQRTRVHITTSFGKRADIFYDASYDPENDRTSNDPSLSGNGAQYAIPVGGRYPTSFKDFKVMRWFVSWGSLHIVILKDPRSSYFEGGPRNCIFRGRGQNDYVEN